MISYPEFSRRFHDHASHDPNHCVAKGIERHLDELPDPSLEHARSQLSAAAALLDDLSAARSAPRLDFDETLDLDLAELALRAEVHNGSYRFNGATTLEQLPSAGSDIGSGIFLLFASDPRPSGERLENITRRLERVPDYLGSLISRLKMPVERWVRMDVEKVLGLESLFDAVEAWARREAWEDRERLHSAAALARRSLNQYTRDLAALPTARSVFLDGSTAARIIELRGIEVPPPELRRWAREFLRETHDELETLRGRLVEKYGLGAGASLTELHDFLNQRFRIRAAGENFSRVIERYSEELDRIVSFVDENELFPILADQRIVILKTPAFMEPSIPAGAMMSPPPFRSGTSQSLVYLTLSEALLAEHTEVSIPMMMIHEGIPGHHLQLATASRHPSTIRRHIEAMDQAEGWTTMLEDYMLDVGYASALSDEVRFCGKRDICRLGARVAIDLFFMSGDRNYLDVGVDADVSSPDPFVAAGNLLAAVTGFVPERVEAELNWYSQERGYPLSYLAGNRLVWQLKADVKRHSGLAGLDLDRTFHRVFLEAGNMPVAMLRRVYRERGLLD